MIYQLTGGTLSLIMINTIFGEQGIVTIRVANELFDDPVVFHGVFLHRYFQ